MNINKKFRSIQLFDIICLSIIFIVLIVVISFVLKRDKFVSVILKVTSDDVLWSDNNPKSWYSSFFHIGQKQLDSIGRPVVEVSSVYSYDTDSDHKATYLTLKLRTNFNSRSKTNYFDGRPVLVGSPLKIELDGVLAQGIITQVDGYLSPAYEIKPVTVNGKVWETDKYIADQYHVGDIILGPDGKPSITIIDKTVVPAEIMTVDSFGNPHTRTNPLKYDIYLTLKVSADYRSGEYYLFGDIRLLIGYPIPFHNKNFHSYPVILGISEQ